MITLVKDRYIWKDYGRLTWMDSITYEHIVIYTDTYESESESESKIKIRWAETEEGKKQWHNRKRDRKKKLER